MFRTCENTDVQHIRWNIFGIHLKKVNILYILSWYWWKEYVKPLMKLTFLGLHKAW